VQAGELALEWLGVGTGHVESAEADDEVGHAVAGQPDGAAERGVRITADEHGNRVGRHWRDLDRRQVEDVPVNSK
jgi:hypothetical protein